MANKTVRVLVFSKDKWGEPLLSEKPTIAESINRAAKVTGVHILTVRNHIKAFNETSKLARSNGDYIFAPEMTHEGESALDIILSKGESKAASKQITKVRVFSITKETAPLYKAWVGVFGNDPNASEEAKCAHRAINKQALSKGEPMTILEASKLTGDSQTDISRAIRDGTATKSGHVYETQQTNKAGEGANK